MGSEGGGEGRSEEESEISDGESGEGEEEEGEGECESGWQNCALYLYTSSLWLNCSEPPRTFSNHFSAENARCV